MAQEQSYGFGVLLCVRAWSLPVSIDACNAFYDDQDLKRTSYYADMDMVRRYAPDALLYLTDQFLADGTYFTGILVMRRFVLDFGQPGLGSPGVNNGYGISSTYTSLFASIVQAGEFVGMFIISATVCRLARNTDRTIYQVP